MKWKLLYLSSFFSSRPQAENASKFSQIPRDQINKERKAWFLEEDFLLFLSSFPLMKTVFIPSRFSPQNPLKAKNVIDLSWRKGAVYFKIMIWVTLFGTTGNFEIIIHLCTRSKRLRVLLTGVCLLWVLLKRRTELYPPRCPFAAFRIFWTAHWDRKCRFSTFQCLGWTFSFSDVLTYELRLQWLQQPTFNRHEPLKLDWKRERKNEAANIKKRGKQITGK